MRRLLIISTILSAAIGLVAAVMWVRGFFVTDVWASHLFTPSAGSMESHTIVAAGGWLISMRSTVILPPGTTPQYQHPMDSSWVHESGPPGAWPGIPPRTNLSLIFWRDDSPAIAPSTARSFQVIATRTFQVTVYKTAGARLLPLMVLSSILPALWLWRLIRARRRARMVGHCPACGYDLRASPERCPECGAIRREVVQIPHS